MFASRNKNAGVTFSQNVRVRDAKYCASAQIQDDFNRNIQQTSDMISAWPRNHKYVSLPLLR